MSIKQKVARKAVKTTVKHTAHGTASKLKRNPARTSSLIALGAIAGLVAGWLLGRKGAGSSPDFAPPPPSVPTPEVPAQGTPPLSSSPIPS